MKSMNILLLSGLITGALPLPAIAQSQFVQGGIITYYTGTGAAVGSMVEPLGGTVIGGVVGYGAGYFVANNPSQRYVTIPTAPAQRYYQQPQYRMSVTTPYMIRRRY